MKCIHLCDTAAQGCAPSESSLDDLAISSLLLIPCLASPGGFIPSHIITSIVCCYSNMLCALIDHSPNQIQQNPTHNQKNLSSECKNF